MKDLSFTEGKRVLENTLSRAIQFEDPIPSDTGLRVLGVSIAIWVFRNVVSEDLWKDDLRRYVPGKERFFKICDPGSA